MIYSIGEFWIGIVLLVASLFIIGYSSINLVIKKIPIKDSNFNMVETWVCLIVVAIFGCFLVYDSYNKPDPPFKYIDVDIQKIRVDDDSEYHLTYIKNGYVESENDIKDWDICIQYGNYNKATGKIKTDYRNENIVACYYIYLPNNFKIEYFDD